MRSAGGVAEEVRWLRLAAHTARLSGDYVAAQFFERQRAGLQQAASAALSVSSGLMPATMNAKLRIE